MRVLVTGGAGFIGSHLVDRLLNEGHEIVVLDNLSTGKIEFIKGHIDNNEIEFHRIDLVKDEIAPFFKGIDEVWHLAANPSVIAGITDTWIDIEQNLIATYRVLEAMRKHKVRKIYFTSSSTVYGDAEKIPTPEDYPTRPISLYGASKLASESILLAYSHMFEIGGVIFRLANIIGPRLTHGVIYDFVQKLKRNKNVLEVLGNGNQRKSYLYVSDCIEAMVYTSKNAFTDGKIEIFNVGSEDWITVREIAQIVTEKMNLKPLMKFGSEERGWKGDVPAMMLDITKIKKLGWRPKYSSKEAVELTAEAIVRNEGLSDERES